LLHASRLKAKVIALLKVLCLIIIAQPFAKLSNHSLAFAPVFPPYIFTPELISQWKSLIFSQHQRFTLIATEIECYGAGFCGKSFRNVGIVEHLC